MPKERKDSSKIECVPRKVLDEVSRVVVGKEGEKEILMISLLCGGHVLIEGPAGTAKTTIAKTFAMAIGGEFKRIQFTPDMLPTDLTGFYLYTIKGSSKFIAGPLLSNIVLADELNRTTARTQSALLEAMQESQITIEGDTRPLPSPFMVIATQIPYGAEGTYPLTDVQCDRFMFRVVSNYPGEDEEREVIARIDYLEMPDVKTVTTPEEIMKLRQEVKKVHVSDEVRNYIVSLVEWLRNHRDTLFGPSTRATIALYKGSRAMAYLNNRDFVLPDDVKMMVGPALAHRVRLNPEAEMEDVIPEQLISKAMEEIPVPKAQNVV